MSIIKQLVFLGLCCCLSVFMFAGPTSAVYLDKGNTADLSGSVEIRNSWRTEDTEGFTSPETKSGDWVQFRNLLYLELNHDLRNVKFPAEFQVKYHLLGRFLYEGIYDLGPSEFQDMPNENYVEDIDDFKWDADLWEGYADISRGPLFFRLGRQNLAWGETDVFRILDNINPLDNTYGGIFEDLDDRRIPLWMARGNYNLGDIGAVSSIGLEVFWVPGALDATVSPLAPPGTPYALPAPSASALNVPGVLNAFERLNEPDKEMDNSRWGVRAQGVYGDNLTLALAYQKTYLDDPAVRSVVDQQFSPAPPQVGNVAVEFSWEQVDVLGTSMNYYIQSMDTVFRSEVGYIWDVPVFISEVNMPDPTLIPTGLPAPAPPVFPQFNSGTIPKKDQVRFSLSFDKSVWIRPLSKSNQWDFTFQYTGLYTKDYDERQAIPVPDPDSGGNVGVKRYEQTLTLVVMNQGGWLNGDLLPQFVTSYDPRGAWFIQPQLEYKFDPFRLKLQYSTITGNFVGFGIFRDRDQVSLGLSWLF
jgi:uncharacterized protein DUF1302